MFNHHFKAKAGDLNGIMNASLDKSSRTNISNLHRSDIRQQINPKIRDNAFYSHAHNSYLRHNYYFFITKRFFTQRCRIDGRLIRRCLSGFAYWSFIQHSLTSNSETQYIIPWSVTVFAPLCETIYQNLDRIIKTSQCPLQWPVMQPKPLYTDTLSYTRRKSDRVIGKISSKRPKD